MLRTVYGQPPAELVVGGFHGNVVADALQAERPHAAHVGTAVVVELFVAPSVALLEHHHGQQDAQRGVRAAALQKERFEDRRVHPLGDLTKKNVMPRSGVVEYRSLAIGQLRGKALEHIYLRGRGLFADT